MGAVFMAEQVEPVRRKVALKIIKLGMDTKSVVARFEAERQALALMDHPNIAKVLDAGATETGRPYFVMELVKGVPIHEYCDKNHLTTRERLELFTQVCRAIQHAHQKGVIHRDIKPSNIMYDPESGAIKITDFGIARITDSSKTKTGTVLGTPNYMSPEQCMGKKVDGRADLFSLGVVMYQLACGDLPFKGDSMATLMFAIVNHKPVDIKTVREDIPPTLRKVIHNSIGKKPEKRYQTGAKMAEHLRVCLERLNNDEQNVSQA